MREPPQQRTSRLDREVRCFRCRKKGHLASTRPSTAALYCEAAPAPPPPGESAVLRSGTVEERPVQDVLLTGYGCLALVIGNVCASRIGMREHVEPLIQYLWLNQALSPRVSSASTEKKPLPEEGMHLLLEGGGYIEERGRI